MFGHNHTQLIGLKQELHFKHASALTVAAKIQPIEFQNQQAVPIRSLTFLPVGRPHPVSGSLILRKLETLQQKSLFLN